MKKILVIAAAIACCWSFNSAKADNIDLQKAKSAATYYMSVLKGGKSISEQKSQLVLTIDNPTLPVAAAYLFNIGDEGYVIVAGSDCATPIIGYSTNGPIDPDNIAPAMLYWLQQYCEPIFDVQQQGLTTTKELQQEWDALLEKTLDPISQSKEYILLIDDEWGQGDNDVPTYNYYCPQAPNGQYCVVGCVATAMSMIMHYWRFPVAGKGSIYYPSTYADINVSFKNARYNYDLMPTKLTAASSQDKIEATALLCYHVAASVKMKFGIDGSGTQSEYVVNALPTYFKYETPKMISRSSYSDQKWIDTLTNEILSGRPVYYAARDMDTTHGRDAAGHAFVCDGIRNGKFHINWGWDGGKSNGFFDMATATTMFNPQGTHYNFNKDHRIVYRITPPADSNRLAITHVQDDYLGEAYPNPATHSITIPHQVKENCTLSIYNMEGKLIESVTVRPGEGQVTLDVSGYPKGVYFYRTTGEGHRIVIE